jgi:5-methylcytosine-specific restriction protein A
MAWEGSTSKGFPPATRRRILQRDPMCTCTGCRACGNGCTRASTDADHIVEVSDGGSHDEANGQGLCHPCHTSKTTAHAARARRKASPNRRPEQHPGLR